MQVDMVLLSASTGGTGIAVVPTSSDYGTSTLIHETIAGATSFDRVFLWAFCNHTSAVVLTLEMGGADDPEDQIVMTIPINVGRVIVCDGQVLNGGLDVYAFAAVTDVIGITGHVLRYS